MRCPASTSSPQAPAGRDAVAMRPAALLSLLLLLLAAACEAAEGGAAVGKRRRRRKPDGADPGFDLFIFVRYSVGYLVV